MKELNRWAALLVALMFPGCGVELQEIAPTKQVDTVTNVTVTTNEPRKEVRATTRTQADILSDVRRLGFGRKYAF